VNREVIAGDCFGDSPFLTLDID